MGLAGGVDTSLVGPVEGDDIVGEESLRGVTVGGGNVAVGVSTGRKAGGAGCGGRCGGPQDKAAAGDLWR